MKQKVANFRSRCESMKDMKFEYNPWIENSGMEQAFKERFWKLATRRPGVAVVYTPYR